MLNLSLNSHRLLGKDTMQQAETFSFLNSCEETSRNLAKYLLWHRKPAISFWDGPKIAVICRLLRRHRHKTPVNIMRSQLSLPHRHSVITR